MLDYLIELRQRALYVLIFFTVFFIIFFFQAEPLFLWLISPLTRFLSLTDSVVATHVTSPIFTPIKLAANGALLMTVPFILLQVWHFVSPGLYRQERRNIAFILFSSVVLFVLGLLFCFYIVLPFILSFFMHATPKGVRMMPDMAYTVDFITHMLLVFGVCFQVPLVCVFLTQWHWLSVETLKSIRPYIIVGSFVLGMLLTPPDVVSQLLVAVPLCILYELGIVLANLFHSPSQSSH